MPAASHITFIKHELDGFHQSLVGYRQQMGAWYSQPLVKNIHCLDILKNHHSSRR